MQLPDRWAGGSMPPARGMQTKCKEGRSPIRALPSELTSGNPRRL